MKRILLILCILTSLLLITGCQVETKSEITSSNEVQEMQDTNSESKILDFGVWEDGIYKNDFLDFNIQIPSDWSKTSDEELARIIELGTEAVYGEASNVKLDSINNGVLMNAKGIEGNINIAFDKNLYNLTKEEYNSALNGNFLNLDNMEYNLTEDKLVYIEGIPFSCMKYYVNTDGITLKQSIYTREINGYFFTVTLTSVAEELDINDFIVKK